MTSVPPTKGTCRPSPGAGPHPICHEGDIPVGCHETTRLWRVESRRRRLDSGSNKQAVCEVGLPLSQKTTVGYRCSMRLRRRVSTPKTVLATGYLVAAGILLSVGYLPSRSLLGRAASVCQWGCWSGLHWLSACRFCLGPLRGWRGDHPRPHPGDSLGNAFPRGGGGLLLVTAVGWSARSLFSIFNLLLLGQGWACLGRPIGPGAGGDLPFSGPECKELAGRRRQLPSCSGVPSS